MKARVTVMLKDGVLDPQGEAVKHALNSLEYNKVESVRQGKVIEMLAMQFVYETKEGHHRHCLLREDWKYIDD